MALIFPPGTPGLVYNGPNGIDYTYDGVLGVWTATAAPAATTTYGLGLEITGSIVKVSIPVASAPPAAGTLATEAVDGSLYWDDNLTQLFIRYNNSGSPVWVAAAPAATGGSATQTFGLGLDVTGTLVRAAVKEATAPPAAGALPTEAVIGSTYYDTNLGAMFIYYSNGASPTWVMV